MNSLLLLKKNINFFVEKLFIKISSFSIFNQRSVLILWSVCALLLPLCGVVYSVKKLHSICELENKTLDLQQLVFSTIKKTTTQCQKDLTQIFANLSNDHQSIKTLLNVVDLSRLEVLKKREQDVLMKKPELIMNPKVTALGQSLTISSLKEPIEISAHKVTQLLQDIEGFSYGSRSDLFFVKLSLQKKDLAEGYTTFICDCSLVKR